jgi:uronate dehydrogenase
MTGASGGIGTSLRKLLPPIYPDLLLSDLKAPADLGSGEKFKASSASCLRHRIMRSASTPAITESEPM